MALFVLSLCPFDISVGVGAFVIGLSQISSFFSSINKSECKVELHSGRYCCFDARGLIIFHYLMLGSK